MTGVESDPPHQRRDPAAARRRRARKKTLRRRRVAAGAVLAATTGALVVLATSGVFSPPRSSLAARRTRTDRTSAPSASSSPSRSPTAHAVARHATRHGSARPAPSPGSLPQTHAYPSAHGTRFESRMAALWEGIRENSVRRALPALFPRGAYVQLKAIADAGSDWTGRLVRDYALDISAAHALLEGDARARLIRVEVDSSYGHWVEPGVCDNSIGYYEMPGARIVYQRAGAIHSFGIASMISWRGEWYVVHLGAVLRPAEEGVVDEPSAGPGVPAYSGTC